jgi:hypothetical protein
MGHSLSADDEFALLANRRRRDALGCLFEHVTVTLADLADEVAIREYDVPLPDISEDDVAEIYFSLYHCHVPKLVDAGYAQYDQEDDLVGLTEHAMEREDRIRDLIDALTSFGPFAERDLP